MLKYLFQGPEGPEPAHGRFICDYMPEVRGVWRVRANENLLVTAVQREGGHTWFEVMDFSPGPELGRYISGKGDSHLSIQNQDIPIEDVDD